MAEKQEAKREKPDFLVYIVESPSPVDLYHKRFEGEMLTKALYLAGIPSIHKLAVNLEAFEASLTIGLDEYLKQPNALFPILHISSHGNRKGIQFTSGEVLEWHKLRDLIMPINKALNGQLVICLSSCESANACCMVMEEGDIPFLVMIGHFGEPTWSDTAIAFATFYHLMGKGKLEKAVEAMKTASGDEGFGVITGEAAKIIFIEAAKKLRIQDIARELSLVRPKTPESPLEKAIKKGE